MNNTIYSGCIWHGEFINLNNRGKEFIEDVRITPLLDSKGKLNISWLKKRYYSSKKCRKKDKTNSYA